MLLYKYNTNVHQTHITRTKHFLQHYSIKLIMNVFFRQIYKYKTAKVRILPCDTALVGIPVPGTHITDDSVLTAGTFVYARTGVQDFAAEITEVCK